MDTVYYCTACRKQALPDKEKSTETWNYFEEALHRAIENAQNDLKEATERARIQNLKSREENGMVVYYDELSHWRETETQPKRAPLGKEWEGFKFTELKKPTLNHFFCLLMQAESAEGTVAHEFFGAGYDACDGWAEKIAVVLNAAYARDLFKKTNIEFRGFMDRYCPLLHTSVYGEKPTPSLQTNNEKEIIAICCRQLSREEELQLLAAGSYYMQKMSPVDGWSCPQFEMDLNDYMLRIDAELLFVAYGCPHCKCVRDAEAFKVKGGGFRCPVCWKHPSKEELIPYKAVEQ